MMHFFCGRVVSTSAAMCVLGVKLKRCKLRDATFFFLNQFANIRTETGLYKNKIARNIHTTAHNTSANSELAATGLRFPFPRQPGSRRPSQSRRRGALPSNSTGFGRSTHNTGAPSSHLACPDKSIPLSFGARHEANKMAAKSKERKRSVGSVAERACLRCIGASRSAHFLAPASFLSFVVHEKCACGGLVRKRGVPVETLDAPRSHERARREQVSAKMLSCNKPPPLQLHNTVRRNTAVCFFSFLACI